MMKKDLTDCDLNYVELTFYLSTEVCRSVYQIKILRENSHLKVLKNNEQLGIYQMNILKELYVWRNFMARKFDESTGYILPNPLVARTFKSIA